MLTLPSVDDAKRLRDFFAESNYKQSEVRDGLALRELPSRRLGNLPHLLDRTRERTRFCTLLRWFFVGVGVDTKTARELIPAPILQILLASGLLLADRDQFVSSVMLAPFEQLLLASDPMLKAESSDRSDLVLWPNPTTWLLWRFTIRRPFESALDLGTGCGVQALMTAAHTHTVTATDLNARAVNFAQFNARLNGLDNQVRCLTGDTFHPVEDQTFDLIVSNPPFFVSPSNRDLFCDNPMDLDSYCRRVVREGSAHLNEGGYLQILCEWVQAKGQPWEERISEWLETTGCDALILKGYSDDPSQYAQKRIRETAMDSDVDGKMYSEWIDYYRQRSVEAIYGGLIALRRRSGQNWTRWEDVANNPKEPFGDSILLRFEARDFLDAHASDQDMLQIRPKLAPNIRLDQQFQHSDSRWQTASLQLSLTNGLPSSIGIQPLVAEFIAQCDGSRTLGELSHALAETVGASTDQVLRECVTLIRKLIERGFATANPQC